jgi:hypothetical protein
VEPGDLELGSLAAEVHVIAETPTVGIDLNPELPW